MFRLCSTRVSNVLMSRLCLTYVPTFSTKIGHVLTVLDLYFDFLDQKLVCRDSARHKFRLSQFYRPSNNTSNLTKFFCIHFS